MYSSSYSAMARLTIDNELPRINAHSPQYPLPSIKDTLSPPTRHAYAHSHSHSYSSSASTSTPSLLPSQSQPGPSRTGRPHSHSVSSMTSPYSMYSSSATQSGSAGASANTSFVNLRSSFMHQSPPRYPHHPGFNDPEPHPSLHRHHSASSLPPNAHGPGYASTYLPTLARTPPVYPEYLERRRSTSASRTANAERRNSGTGSDHGLGLGFAHEDSPHSGANSPRTRTALMMTPNHSGGPGQRRQQGFAVPGHTPPATDPSAVRRLAHLQCEQRRRESINGGFATLRSILPETTNADSKAAILQRAINYIQHLEQAVRASGGKIENAVKLASDLATTKTPNRRKKSSLSTADTSPACQEADVRDLTSPIRDAVEDMAVDMEMSEGESEKEKRGALYMLGSVASAAAPFDSHLPELNYGREAGTHSIRNRLGFLKASRDVEPDTRKEAYDKVATWEHVEDRVYRS